MDWIRLNLPRSPSYLAPRFIAFSSPLSCLLPEVIGYDEPIHGKEAIEEDRRALKDKLKDPYGFCSYREGNAPPATTGSKGSVR